MEIKTIDQILNRYSSLNYNTDKTKIFCAWSGHELPLKIESIQSYVNGNKYKKLLEKNINQNDMNKYMHFLVPSNKPKRENQYFCKLTLRHCNKLPDHVQKHINGKRFQKAYKHYLHCQETNQEFIPFPKQAQLKLEAIANDETNDNDDDSDNMSDLFPEEMLDLIDDNNNNNELNQIESLKQLKVKDDDLMDQIDDDDGNDGISSNKRKHDIKINKKSIEPRKKKTFKS